MASGENGKTKRRELKDKINSRNVGQKEKYI